MGSVIVKFSKGCFVWTIGSGIGRSIRPEVWPQPETTVGSSCASIMPEYVERINNPETARRQVGVEKTGGHSCKDYEIILEGVVDLYPILKKY